ncbi:MAG: S9 family peptidase [Alphaproteobacteria bacterium]|nr:MAG: S9 family peptidase [Alphaproteobacteria bacterium]
MIRHIGLATACALLLAGCDGAKAPDETAAPGDWPYAQDIPQPESVTPGLAGESPVDIVRFLMVRGIRGASLAPDGRHLAYLDTVTGKPQLWIVDAAGGWPQQLTFGAAVTFYRWLPDGSGLLYAADREGNEREAYWVISADGRHERQVLDYADAFRAFGDFNEDGSRFVYSSTKRNGRDFDVYVADTASGETRLVHEGHFGYFARDWQPGGSHVLVSETRGEDGNDLHLLDVETGDFETLFAPEVSAYYGDFAWAPDGAGFYLVTDQDREFRALAHYDLAARTLEIIEAPEHDVDDLALSGDGRYLVWTTNEGGYSVLHGRDLKSGTALTPPDLPPGIYGVRFATAAPRLVISVNGPQVAGDVYVWDLESGTLTRPAAATMAGIDPDRLVVPESLFFPARDGVTLHGLLYLPKETVGAEKPPVVVSVHGGPTAQARPGFRAVTQYLVGRGIAVLDVNVRGSTGFGKTYARLDNQRLRPNAVRDLVDALAFLGRDGRVDADRAAVMGGSYGGYMVNAVLGSYPDAFDAGVSFVGVSDWVRALEEASPALKASDRLEYGDITDPDDRAFFAELSPMARADRIRAPMLVEHGANDPRDPVTESDRLVKAVRANGVPVTYLRFPDEGHGVRKLANRVTLYRRVAAFLEEQLGVTSEPED